MTLTLLAPGKLRMAWIKEGCALFEERLQHYVKLKIVEVREESVGKGIDPKEVKRREAERIQEKLPPGALVIALDEHGKSLSSVAFAQLLGEFRDRGTKEVVLVLGGPLGLDPDWLARASVRLSLSSMTLTHELARLVLLEQTYRAFTILAGEPYHNP